MINSVNETRMHFSTRLADGRSGVGRQILPQPQSPEEWKAAGVAPVEEPYDAYAVSVVRSSKPVWDGRGGYEQHVERDFWAVAVIDSGETVDRLEVDKVSGFSDPNTYTDLRDKIEQHIGRTGLLILVS